MARRKKGLEQSGPFSQSQRKDNMADKDILAPVKLVRAHWIGEDRHEIGASLDLEPAEARRLINAGVAVRNDPLPGEEPA